MHAFSVSFDYRCPSSYVTHTHILDALDAGADWDVTFRPFSLTQSHVPDGEPPVWERPEIDSGLEALQVAVAVRDQAPDAFRRVHRGLFAHRHVEGRRLDRDAINGILGTSGVDADTIWSEVASGRPLVTVATEHTAQVENLDMWGVPTFVIGDQAVFVRINDRPDGDGDTSRTRIEKILVLMTDFPGLNEFKHTSMLH